jgi:hypothetical protein
VENIGVEPKNVGNEKRIGAGIGLSYLLVVVVVVVTN